MLAQVFGIRPFAVVVPILVASASGAAQQSMESVDPWIATELAKLVASDGEPNDEFGRSVAVSGDTAVVGAYRSDHAGGNGAGSAYVFERNQGGAGAWGELVKLTASDAGSGDWFGVSVALSGDTAVVGAQFDDLVNGTIGLAGSAYVFERDQGGAGAWGEVEKLSASDAAIADFFGKSVAISGDTIVVGAFGKAGGGSAYVFERDQGGAGAWGEVGKLIVGNAAVGDQFGFSVAVSGDFAMVGAPNDDLVNGSTASEGSAFVFERNRGGVGAWGEVKRLSASDAAASDFFGNSVAVSGDTAVIGAYYDDHAGGTDAGSGYVFERNQGGVGAWGEVSRLSASDAAPGDLFGVSVAIAGDTAVVGAYRDDHAGGTDAGSGYVFERHQGGVGAWGEVQKLTASDAAAGDRFGEAVAISGETVVVGADWDFNAGGFKAGSAYVYGTSFSSSIYCTAGTSASGCRAGISAAGTAPPSATATSGFVLTVSNVEAAKNGMFFYGVNGRQANSWGNGTSYRCVTPPVKRGGLLGGVGTGGACDGSFTQDLNARWCPTCPKPSHNPGAGAFVQTQFWYRDPLNTSNQTTSLSDAVEFLVSP